MTTPQDASPPGREPARGQDQDPPAKEKHGGTGADSAMRQMRVWEQRRASSRIGKMRDKPSSS